MFHSLSSISFVYIIWINAVRKCFAVNLCQNVGHTNGTWVKDESIKSKNYQCCGYDSLDHRHNIDVCGGVNLKGLQDYFGSNDHRSQVGGSGCSCDSKYGRTSVNARETYKWVPSNCDMIKWNATRFCNVLENRTIYLHGDSTMDQAANSLLSQIFNQNGGCANRIFFHREYNEIGNRGLLNRLKVVKPSIAIFNFGAHAHNDEDINVYWKAFNDTFSSPSMQTFQKEQNITFIWRTNHPGHVNCYNAIEPSNNISIRNFPQYKNTSIDPHNWSGFNKWDYQCIENARGLGMKILDMSPLYSRSDSHPQNGDCLHYCLPGPIDIFANLLFQMLWNKEI
jgi:hypothetical protein